MTANYKHIRFEEIQGFTVCRSNHGGAVLGRVEWMARWKEYEFIPEPDTAYTVECLRDLADFVGKMNAARKANRTSGGTRPMTTETTSGSIALPPTAGSAGPTHCDICGEWPARQTERGKRCQLCESREWCAEHPVPLPSNLETVKELADLGYAPAIRHLSQNIKGQTQRPAGETP